MDSGVLAVYTTLPREEAARGMARALVEEGLVACAHIFAIGSVYRWKGKLSDDREWALLLKTRAALYERVAERIRGAHPYELPAIVAFPITHGLPEYLAWIADSTAAAEGS